MGIKISELESTTTANANDVFIINQNGATKKITKENLENQIINPELEERVDVLEEEVEALQNQVTDLEETVNSELEDGTATGTEITVNDSAVADASLDIGGNTEQAQYEGNQLINFASLSTVKASFTFQNDILAITSTETYARANKTITDIVKNNAGKILAFDYDTINVSQQFGTIVQLIIEFNNGTSTIYRDLLTHNLTRNTYTIPTDTSTIRSALINFYSNNSGTAQSASVTITKPILHFGAEKIEYEPFVDGQASPSPDYPQDIHVLKGSNTIKIYNANIFDGVMEQGQINTVTGLNTNSSTIIRTKNFFKIPKEVTTLKIIRTVATGIWVTREYDEDKNYLGFQIKCNANVYSNQFTLLEGTRYIRFVDLSNDLNGKWCLTSDLSETEIVESEQQVKTLTLPNGMEMCKIGDYKDEFVKDLSTGKWYKDEKITKAVFDGTEEWYINSSVFNIRNLNYASTDRGTISILCNSYIAVGNVSSSVEAYEKGNYTTCHYYNNTTSRLFIRDDRYTTVESFKAYLAEQYANGTPIISYYILETPILEEITDETLINELDELLKLRTYYGQTNITVEAGDAKPYMTLNYKKSNRAATQSELVEIKQAILSLGGNI